MKMKLQGQVVAKAFGKTTGSCDSVFFFFPGVKFTPERICNETFLEEHMIDYLFYCVCAFKKFLFLTKKKD